MPVTYRIDLEREIVFSKAEGSLHGGDFLAHQVQLVGDPQFRSDFNQLFDTRGVTQFDFSSDVIRSLVSGNPFGRGSRRAFVAQSDVVYGALRMFEMMTDDSGAEISVFRSMDEALSWLGLHASEL